MGWTNNPRQPWREFESALSWRSGTGARKDREDPRPPPPAPPDHDWGRYGELRLLPRARPARAPRVTTVPYAELHCHSYFSFLDGVSDPAELVDEADALGLRGLALTDHDGLYGVVRFSRAARDVGMPTVFGAELSLDLPAPQGGIPDPAGSHLVVLARQLEGYQRLSAVIARAQLAGGEKGRPRYDLPALAGELAGHAVVLSGCRKGAVRGALARHGLTDAGRDAAEAELRTLIDLFGADAVFVELIDHDQPTDDAANDLLAEAARHVGVATVATNNVHYARPEDHDLANALASLRARRSLDVMEGWLPAAPTAHLRSGEEMAARFDRFPGALARSVEIARLCGFDFETVAPRLPDFPVPPDHNPASWLRHLVTVGARRRYGPRDRRPEAYRQLEHELRVIEELEFPGYFLIVSDIVEFCRRNSILCQGRGSAANSAVCYALGITNVDAVKHQLLFERFLSPTRDGPPDIDLDIESGRRERVIQYVYERYGRERAAQVANVITYRTKLALRDAARVLGYATGTQDAWARQIGPHEPLPGQSGEELAEDVPERVVELADRLLRLPRHLGIHSGGMVICDRPIAEVVPVEWARMADRSVVQWDKDDCADAKLVKFDLLGLGMLGALHDAFDLVRAHHDPTLGFDTVPSEDAAVYEMLAAADSVGVFQVESRAQMATLPRLKPRTFYDLVVEVALIRPGPIQGGAVHPYLRRRDGDEEPAAPHHLLEPVLRRTLGVPLFQEQVMQMAIVAAGFSAAESDQLRRAMSSKRSDERMAALRARLMAGMASRDIPPDVAEDIYTKLHAFASFGFPESHSISFAYLVYVSAYLKRYYPAAFTTALLNNQPMGFYSPASLISDVRRHGVEVRGLDVNASDAQATLEPPPLEPSSETTAGAALPPRSGARRPRHRFASPHPQPAIRLGLADVRGLSKEGAERIAVERRERGVYTDVEDFVRRTELSLAVLEALATAGGFGCFDLQRREALWQVGVLAGSHRGHLPGSVIAEPPPLPAMTPVEQTLADLWATSASPDSHPIQHLRARLDERGITTAAGLHDLPNRRMVRVAGLVTHRQRPPTAGGTCFLSLEDETGMTNIICPPAVWCRQRRTALDHAALIVHGVLERAGEAINVVAGRLEPLRVATRVATRDFR